MFILLEHWENRRLRRRSRRIEMNPQCNTVAQKERNEKKRRRARDKCKTRMKLGNELQDEDGCEMIFAL